MVKYDYVVVGSGLSGSTYARIVAEKGYKVLVVERRNVIAGNLYDEMDSSGVMVQRYGPHTFHTNDENVWSFVQRFATWEPYKLKCEVDMLGQSTPSPFNFKTIDQFFTAQDSRIIKDRLKMYYPDRLTVTIVELLSHGDPIIKEYAEFLFKNDYSQYTAKQWGLRPEDVDVSVLKRVPVRLDYQEMYFTDKYEGLPKEGYTQFVKNILNHPNINVLHDDAKNHISFVDKRVVFHGVETSDYFKLVYTGAIDELFLYKYSPLPYRSLRFEYKKLPLHSYQNAAIVAYPQAKEFTRITEYTKLPVQDVGNVTIIAKEYPQQYEIGSGKDPYYPIPSDVTDSLYQKYKKLAETYRNLVLCGRLADYKYYNMDQAISAVFKKLDY